LTKELLMRIFFSIYHDGFRHLSKDGKILWAIIIIKLCIMFLVLKLFFFPDFLKTKFKSDKERSNYVIEHLTK